MGLKRLVTILTLLLLVGVISAEAAIPSATAAGWDWTVNKFDDDEKGVLNLSTTFVGLNELPMLSYSREGMNRIYQAYLAPSDNLKNCGPNNAWFCTDWHDNDLSAATVSNAATFRYGTDNFGIFWAYQAGSYIRGAKVEYTNDLTLVADDWENLIDVGKFGDILVGAPSLINKEGKFRLAVTIRDNSGFFVHKLVYMWYLGIDNTSCISSGSKYQCDVIESAIGMGSIGAPSLQVSLDGKVGIAYYYVRDLKYAYPFPESAPKLSMYPNCGPDSNTWRCITIFDVDSPNKVGTNVKQALGMTNEDRGIAFTYHDTYTDALKLAEYVGSGGNCGEDGKVFYTPVRRWQCSDVDNIAYTKKISFSVAIDPEGFPVIAFNTDDGFLPYSLYLSYPYARVGVPGGGWLLQTIDPAPPIYVSDTTMTVRVWSPDAGIPVRLKVEDAADGTKSVETEATTTVAGAWETLTFDFANEAAGTAALDLTYTYNKISIFFDFGAIGADKIYYFDDVTFSGGTTTPPAWDPITFDDPAVTYTLTGFGGADDSQVVMDPTDAANKVARVVKAAGAEVWAGTTVSTGPNQSVPALPFTANVGFQAALALNTDGLGFIAYRVDGGYLTTEPLKIALQKMVFNLYLPMILR